MTIRLLHACAVLASLTQLSSCLARQHAFVLDDEDGGLRQAAGDRGPALADDSYKIFNAVYSAGRRWGSSLKPRGASVVPARIKAGALLYHARYPDTVDVPSPEWFALEPDLSYDILGTEANSTLRTYQLTAPLDRLLYFDGITQDNVPGSFDLQDLLAFGEPTDNDDAGQVKYERARRLCDWGRKYGLQGFLRGIAGVEIIVCDIEAAPMQLLSKTRLAAEDTWAREYTRLEVLRSMPWLDIGSQYIEHDLTRMVTMFGRGVDFDPHFNGSKRIGDFPRQMWPGIKRDIEAAVDQPWSDESEAYRLVSDRLVTHYGDRLRYLEHLLSTHSQGSRTIAKKLVAYLMCPFTAGSSNDPNGVLERCTNYPLGGKQGGNRVLDQALQIVSQDICKTLLSQPDAAALADLRKRLDWAVWYSCQPACTVDEVCAVMPEAGLDFMMPHCYTYKDLEQT